MPADTGCRLVMSSQSCARATAYAELATVMMLTLSLKQQGCPALQQQAGRGVLNTD